MSSSTPVDTDRGPTGSPRRVGAIALAVVCALALVAALVMATLWLTERSKAGEVRTERAVALEERQKYVDTASDVLTRLMTIRQDSLEDDVAAISERIEGDFAEQFTPRADSYQEVVEITKVVADGEIVAAAVEREDEGRADVIMAVDQTITNPAEEDPQERYYRMRITVNQHEDGSMKVSGVNFVP